MEYVIGIGIIALVAAVIVGIVSARRSRLAKSSWLGELADIRMSSLGDDREVTGAIHAVTLDEAFDDEPALGEAPMASTDPTTAPEPESGSEPVDESESATTVPALSAVAHPDRIISDGTQVFHEYRGDDGSILRFEVDRAATPKVLADRSASALGFAVEYSRGTLWHQGGGESDETRCTIRTPAGWVITTGTVAVVIDAHTSFVMCLAGRSNLRIDEDRQYPLTSGQVARFGTSDGKVDVLDVGVDALESEGVVRRQRRLGEATDDGERGPV